MDARTPSVMEPVVRAATAARGTPYLDMTPAFQAHHDPVSRLYLLQRSASGRLSGDGHVSREGSAVIGQTVAEWLARIGLVHHQQAAMRTRKRYIVRLNVYSLQHCRRAKAHHAVAPTGNDRLVAERRAQLPHASSLHSPEAMDEGSVPSPRYPPNQGALEAPVLQHEQAFSVARVTSALPQQGPPRLHP
jgi:hypothetical protein